MTFKNKMKIFIVSSKHFYEKVNEVKSKLEKAGHKITLPVSFDNPFAVNEFKKTSKEKHLNWMRSAFKEQEKKVKANDAILVINLNKNKQSNYIGGSVFLELYEAWRLNKKIFLYNPLPENILKDEIEGFDPVVINGNLNLIQ